jgi:hypothetical protein
MTYGEIPEDRREDVFRRQVHGAVTAQAVRPSAMDLLADKPATDWEVDTLRDILNIIQRDGARLIATTNLRRPDMRAWLADDSVTSRLYADAREVDGFIALEDWRGKERQTEAPQYAQKSA